jgi:hypothetical protein
MSNYYITKCCKVAVDDAVYNCPYCGLDCEVTAVIDSPAANLKVYEYSGLSPEPQGKPGGVPEEKCNCEEMSCKVGCTKPHTHK